MNSQSVLDEAGDQFVSVANAWANVAIDDLCADVFSGGTPLTSRPDYYVNGNIPWLKTKEVNHRRIYTTENYITQLGLESSSAKLVPANSVTVAMYGDGQTAGRVGLTKIPLATNQACCNLIIDRRIADPEFVFYQLVDAYESLVARKTGSGQQNLNGQIIRSFKIPLPPLLEQQAIASVLSSLDEKIDLLHRQNKTLEAMAEALFRQWFVEEAGAEWREGTVEELFVLQRGFDLPAQSRTEGPYPIFAASGFSGGHVEYKVKGPGVTTGRSGLLGKVFLVLEDFWPLNTSLYVKEFRLGTPLFAYQFLKTLDLMAFNAGSAVPTLNRNHVHSEKVVLPPRELIDRFEATMQPVFQKIEHNASQRLSLEKLRDALLPKLMSGEVRVAY